MEKYLVDAPPLLRQSTRPPSDYTGDTATVADADDDGEEMGRRGTPPAMHVHDLAASLRSRPAGTTLPDVKPLRVGVNSDGKLNSDI